MVIKIAICGDDNFVCSEIEKIILDYQKYTYCKFDIDTFASYIVNFDKITYLKKDYLIMSNNVRIPVSQRNLKDMRTMLLNSKME